MSGDTSTYATGYDKSLSRLHLTPTEKGPIGMARRAKGRFLYNLNEDKGNISAFRVDKNNGQPHADPESRCWVKNCFRNDGALIMISQLSNESYFNFIIFYHEKTQNNKYEENRHL